MRFSARSPPVSTASMSQFESNSERSFHTKASSLVPLPVVPKYFNIPFALHHGYFRCVRYLLELSHDPNERDNNDRWSLSLAQNLLEKRAKIALADNARRNAMHHACALQRLHLVQLYLSCLEFSIESKDCDGNTYLHYAAITGNCEIAELLMRIADKMNVRLDQCVNREGCTAAILALKYGHIGCANQITHRDWDEFFVIPRPLSVYETPATTEITHTATASPAVKQRSKASSTTQTRPRPSALSFGVLKILFNDSDTTYSTHLAKLCGQGQPKPPKSARPKTARPSLAPKKLEQNKSIVSNGTGNSSVDTLLSEKHPRKEREGRKTSPVAKEPPIPNSLPPRRPTSARDGQSVHRRTRPNINPPLIIVDDYDDPASRRQSVTSPIFQSSQVKTNFQRPQTAMSTRTRVSNDSFDITPRAHPSPPTVAPRKRKKKSPEIIRPQSASIATRPTNSNLTFQSSTYSKTLYAGRPLSAVLENHHCRSPVQQIVDPSCSIREVTGVAAASRYNNPVELFGIKPEDLFGVSPNPTRLPSHRETQLKHPSSPQQYVYQQDIDKLTDLYATQHTFSYRRAVTPPAKAQARSSTSGEKHRRISSSKGSVSSSRASTTLKPSTLAALNISRRFCDTRRLSVKTVHT